ncbi:MAG: hypothetical protein NAG76_14270 [Candidatus Pristimantibacillus lignocellulolyticus]|uniref:Uncharacterized protein n=1 Tax=Candidatus Pristimantibacillus lignocellulolyticus TaxID=2994561 RepID=A0A9J6Z9Y5_9BACL|nr:MAG: hypothetical protein NAG76_14270 [Candidatus Pristimantibacillus lignocellulolyticus]
MSNIKQRKIVGLFASIFLIFYGIWKLNRFFEPKVGPVGNGPSDTLVGIVWLLFGTSMILGVGGVIYFSYSINKRNN